MNESIGYIQKKICYNLLRTIYMSTFLSPLLNWRYHCKIYKTAGTFIPLQYLWGAKSLSYQQEIDVDAELLTNEVNVVLSLVV